MSDFKKMQKLIENADAMIAKDITNDDAEFVAWETSVKRLLNGLFGQDGIEMKSFLDISFYRPSYSFGIPDTVRHSNAIKSCHEGLRQAKAILETYLDELEDNEKPLAGTVQSSDFDKVFVVHGHDGELKESVARIIEKQGIEAIILSEKANQGRTIIEKFEDYSNVGGAICLFTSDDVGYEKSEMEGNPRARQNVVFEAGYFMGKLGRNRVVILADNGVEMPSDLSGVVYTNTANWQFELLKDMNAMGYKVDMNRLL